MFRNPSVSFFNIGDAYAQTFTSLLITLSRQPNQLQRKMSDFGKALNRIVQGRDESAEEIETVAVKRARGLPDNIVDLVAVRELSRVM